MFVQPRGLGGGEENLRAGVEPLAEDQPHRTRQIGSKCSQGRLGLPALFLLGEARCGRLKQGVLNNTDQVGHSPRVEHFIKFGGQQEVQEMVEGVGQEPAEGGDELEPAVREVAESDGQVLDHLVHPTQGTLLGRPQTQGLHLVQLRKVFPEYRK